MYPWGRACLENQCRNSLSGLCSSDCSDSACNQDVPVGKLNVLYPDHKYLHFVGILLEKCSANNSENQTPDHRKTKFHEMLS